MTSMTDRGSKGEGVAAERTRKRRIWLLVAAAVVIGGAIDAVIIPMVRHAPPGGPYLSPAVAIVSAALMVLMMTLGVWLYMRWVDELDRQQNVAAFSIGFIFHLSAYAAWFLQSEAGLAGPPRADVLFFASAAAASLAYCWMKLRVHVG